MKISRKSIALASAIIAIGGISLIFYLTTKNSDQSSAWMNSNWLYRRSISVGNSGGTTLTNEDVLVELDTASLISAGKLQNDCDDLRFVDSDDSTSISYWVEGGCNTSSTQIWVRIPSLPSAGKTIYVYYGNGSAANAEASWTGKFIVLSNTSCNNGWTYNSSFENRFPKVSTSYGSTGGSSTHTHNNLAVTFSGVASGKSLGGSEVWRFFPISHTHTATISFNSANNLPSYISVPFCESSKLTMYTNNITIFESIPSGWSNTTALNGKFPLGGSSYGSTGGSDTHIHTTVATTTSSRTYVDEDNEYQGSGNTIVCGNSHAHTVSSQSTGTGSSLPPYQDLIFANPSSTRSVPVSTLSMVSSLPPMGWSTATAISSNEYIRGNSSSSGSGGTSSHNHSLTINTDTYANNCQVETGSSGGYSDSHSHSATSTLVSTTIEPPYYTVLVAKKDTSQSTTINAEEMDNVAPNAPTSLQTESQTNPTGVSDTTPEFSAIFSDSDTGDTGNYYQIQVNTASDFSGTSMWDSTKTAFGSPTTNNTRSSQISYAGTSISLNGTTYYWRIKFWDDSDEEGPWSTTAQFTMNDKPNAPTSLQTESQTNPVKVLDTTPEFKATYTDPDSDNGTSYQIQVNTASDFSGTSMWDSTKTAFNTPVTHNTQTEEISYAGTSLSPDATTYYWKIKIWDTNDNESDWSTTNTFQMQGPPNTPTALTTDSETNPTELSTITPTFSALYTDPNEDDASAYEIEVNSSSDFLGTVMWDTDKTNVTITHNTRSSEIQYDGTQLSNSENIYYWRIRFWDTEDAVSNWSATAQFTDLFPSLRFGGVGLEGIKIN